MKKKTKISHLEDDRFMRQLFPFYILMDDRLSIKKTGPSIQKLLTVPSGKTFFNHFEIERPLVVNSFEDIIKQQSSLFIFRSKAGKKLKFRGQMYCDEAHQLICFLGGPLLNSFDELEKVDLSFDDFAIHDNISQFLFTLQMQISSMKDAKKIADRLKKSNHRLEEMNESLDEFIYKMTHDLRAPAINIKSMLTMLTPMLKLEKESRAAVIFSHAKDATKNLLNIIDDFLELSKMEKKGGRKARICNLNDILSSTEKDIALEIKENNAAIIKNFNACERVFFTTDDLKSIIQNLLTNAIKYKSPNRDPEISFTSTIQGAYAKIEVADNGMGIDLEKQKDKTFQMFSRLHASPTIKGAGIGLYLVKKLVEKNKGTINVVSQPNKGTTFTLYLPLPN